MAKKSYPLLIDCLFPSYFKRSRGYRDTILPGFPLLSAPCSLANRSTILCVDLLFCWGRADEESERRATSGSSLGSACVNLDKAISLAALSSSSATPFPTIRCVCGMGLSPLKYSKIEILLIAKSWAKWRWYFWKKVRPPREDQGWWDIDQDECLKQYSFLYVTNRERENPGEGSFLHFRLGCIELNSFFLSFFLSFSFFGWCAYDRVTSSYISNFILWMDGDDGPKLFP